MGFWHTGYIEFHEPVGLEGEWTPIPARFPCSHCTQEFESFDELRKHRFEAHPLRRPVMLLRGRELGRQRVKITQPVVAAEVKIDGADRAVLNGKEIAVSGLSRALTRITSDICQIILSKDGVDAQFELEMRIASERDLRGVEEQFRKMALSHRLDVRAVEDFISGASRFGSAMGYCDGICAYLYGILAKERAADSSLKYEAYRAKFAKAAEELAGYDRKLARAIRGVIEFHFNHFEDAARLCPGSRLGVVAGRYAAWVKSRSKRDAVTGGADGRTAGLDALVTDWETEEIIRWSSHALAVSATHAVDIEHFLKRDLADYDRVKLHILLGELHASSGNSKAALKHARELRNLSAVERWAEAMIREVGGNE